MTDIQSLFGFTWWHLALAAGLCLLVLLQGYRWMIAPLPMRQRLLLLAIRLGWMGMLLWCLFQPVRRFEQQIDKTITPHVVTLLDASTSMNTPDSSGKPHWPAVRDATTRLDALLKKAKVTDVSRLAFGERIRSYHDLPTPSDEQSNLVAQLTQVISQESRESQPTVLFLITDGQDTAETSASSLLAFAATRKVQVVPIVPAGLVRPPALARVDKITAPSDVTVSQAFDLAADIRLRRGDAASMTVILERDGREVARKPLAKALNNTAQVTFAARADRAGFARYTFRLIDDKSQAEASRLSAIVQAHTQQNIRVLYVQGALDWEYKFIRSAVAENPSLQLDGVSRLNPTVFLKQASGASVEYAKGDALQALRSASFAYDVVVLANVNPELLDAPMQQLLSELVTKRGGGILFLSGNSAQAAEFRATRLEQLLPVTFPDRNSAPVIADETSRQLIRIRARAPTLQEEEAFTDAALQRQGDGPLKNLLAMRLTPAGQLSEVWRDAAKRETSAMSAPPATFLEAARVESAKPAATVLATHPTLTNRDALMPVLVIQNIGAGRSAFLGVDSLWRWRMRSPSEAREYDRFWQQLFLWLGGRLQRSDMAFDRGRYQPGDTIKATLRLDNPDQRTTLVMRRGDGPEQPVPLTWREGNRAASAELKAEADGELLFTARRGDDTIAQQIVEVRKQDLEREYAGLNEPLLQQLASVSHGQVLAASDLDSVNSILKPRTEKFTRRELFPLWDSVWIFVGIVALCSTEWLIRRRYSLT